MIFKIRLPILDNLLGIISDDPERSNVGKHPDKSDHMCWCICHVEGYMDGTFYGMWS